MAFTNHGISWYGKGIFDKAIKYLSMGAELCERMHDPTWGAGTQFWLAETYFQTGDYQQALERYHKAIGIFENKKIYPSAQNLFKLGLTRAMVQHKDKDIDLESLFECVKANKQKNCEGILRRFIAEILLNMDNQHISEAKHWIEEAIEADKKNGMMFSLGRNYVVYAEILKRPGENTKAKENLKKAIEIFKECAADGWAEKAEKELEAL